MESCHLASRCRVCSFRASEAIGTRHSADGRWSKCGHVVFQVSEEINKTDGFFPGIIDCTSMSSLYKLAQNYWFFFHAPSLTANSYFYKFAPLSLTLAIMGIALATLVCPYGIAFDYTTLCSLRTNCSICARYARPSFIKIKLSWLIRRVRMEPAWNGLPRIANFH